VVTKAASQWRDLAARIAAGIRTVDAEHMLFVERLNSVAGDWSEDAERGFFRIPDPNTVYEFHFYKPFHFTHQSASWVPFAAENVRYPDARAEVEWFLLDRKGGTEASPKLPVGDSPWTFYPGAPFKVDDPAIVVGKPVLVVKQSGAGKVWFDDLTLEELDDAGQVKRVIWEKNLTGTRGWYFWTKDAGKGGAVRSESGHGDGASIVATNTVGDANLGADVLRFRTTPSATYRLSGWMRGEKIPPQATCQIRLDLFTSRAKVHDSDRAFVEQEIDAYLAWGKREKVPLFLGETGVIRFGFDEDRGGLRWVSDLLDIARAKKLSFTYHAYHEDAFGIYRGAGSLPDPARANTALIELFTSKLKAKK
jgi:endoglucanase